MTQQTTVWLIERGGSGQQPLEYIGINMVGNLGWTADITKAIQFARATDGQSFKEAGRWMVGGLADSRVSVQQHIFSE